MSKHNIDMATQALLTSQAMELQTLRAKVAELEEETRPHGNTTAPHYAPTTLSYGSTDVRTAGSQHRKEMKDEMATD
jgi:hypothetical protein